MRTIAIMNFKGRGGQNRDHGHPGLPVGKAEKAGAGHRRRQSGQPEPVLRRGAHGGRYLHYPGTADLRRWVLSRFRDTHLYRRRGCDPRRHPAAGCRRGRHRPGETHREAIEDLRGGPGRDAGDPDGYDYLLIDCPPALSTACAAALIAADEVIIPIRLDAFSTGGMSNLVFQITNMRRINPRLRVRGVLVTQYTKTEEERQALEVLRSSQLPVFETVIRFSKRVCAGTFAKMPLVEFFALVRCGDGLPGSDGGESCE